MGKTNVIVVGGEKSKEELKKAIISIGENLIEKADEICRDIDLMKELEIKAIIVPFQAVDYSINKKYLATFNEPQPKDIGENYVD